MRTYLCFIYVAARTVPELRALPCETDAEVLRELAAIVQEWPSTERLEVTDGFRTVADVAGSDLLQLG